MIRFPSKLTKEGFRRSSTLHPVFLSIKDELIPCSMASMILPEGENLAYRDFVRLYTADGDMGVYMVTAPSDSYPGNPSITLCHAICLLDDIRIRGSGTLSGTFGEVVQQILQQQTDASPLFTAGSFADSDITIRVEYDDDTLLSLIKTACTRAYDQRLTIDQTTTPWVLGSVSVPTTPTAEGRFTRNLESVRIDTDGDDQCTRLVVVHTDWNTGDITYTTHDADTISQYGVIEDVWSVPYGATEEDANAYIAELLRQRGEPTVSIDVDSYDLHAATGETLDGFDPGDLMRCCLPEYKTTVNARITTVEYPDVYGSPDARRVSLRNKTQTLADLLIEIKKEARRAGRGAGRAASAAAAARWGLNLTHEDLEDMGDYWRHEFNVVGLRFDAAEALVQAHATNIETLFNDTGELQTTTGEVLFELDGIKRELALKAYEKTVNELTGEVESLGTTVTVSVDGLRATVQKNDETLSALNNTINGLESWVTDGAENISELTNTVRGLESIVKTVDGRTVTLSNTADGLTSTLLDQSGEFAEFRTRINEIAGDVKDANGNLGSFAATAGSVAAKITAVDGRVGALGVTADEILGRVSDQSNAFAALSIRIDEISQSVQDANGALGQISVQAGRIAATVSDADERLSSKLELLEGALNLEAQADGTVVSLRLDAVENRITAQANTISGISGDVNRINNSINVITGSMLWQDRDKIVGTVGKVTTIEDNVSAIRGSTLWQTRDSITGLVGKMSVGNDGDIYVQEGSGLRIYKSGVAYGVYDENNLTAGLLVEKLNDGSTSAKLKAEVINLEGFVKATTLETNYAKISDLNSVKANITNLTSGLTVASVLSANLIDGTQGRFTYLRGDAINMGDNNLVCYTLDFAGRSGKYFGTDGGLDLQHSHSVTVNDDGTITLGEVSAEGGNFRIADTKTYKDGVSAAKASVKLSAPDGWQNGRFVVVASNGETLPVELPTFSTSGGTAFDSDHKTKVYFFTPSVSGPLREAEVDASSVYKSGWNECRAAMTRINNLYTISQNAPGTLYMLVNGSYTSVGADWVKVASYTSAYRRPAEIA